MTVLHASELLTKYNLRAKKGWGQNFLIEEQAYSDIVHACGVTRADWVIEIGCGLGTLTSRLGEAAGHVVGIERERDMIEVLKAELGGEANIEIVEANALTFNYEAVAARTGALPVVVGNLPYQIASPIIFRLLESRRFLRRIVIMVQLEMAERICAAADTSEYGALSVMLQMYFRAQLVRKVKAGAFLPAPRVDSAIVRLDPFADAATAFVVRDEALFSKIVHAAFQMRRKTLRNSLRSALDDVDGVLAAAQIDPKRRGETLSVSEFARLTEIAIDHAALQRG